MDMWRDILATQKLHPEKFLYTKTCLFRLDEAGAAEETWIWIDEYQDRETYDRQEKILQEDPEVVALKQKWHARWDPIRIPGSMKTECWLEQFRVEFEGRAGSR
jgi:hypothetical protein